MQRSALNQEIREGADLHHVNSGLGGATATATRTDIDITMAPQTTISTNQIHADTVLRENVTTTREYIKDELVVQQSAETIRQAPIVHEKHIYHEQPMLQERHIYKEVPVVERTVVHEQPSLTTRDVIHELPVQIKQSSVIKEAMPVQHEVQKVQHELRVVEDKTMNQQHIHQQGELLQGNLQGQQLGAQKVTQTTTTTTTTKDSGLVTGSAAPKDAPKMK